MGNAILFVSDLHISIDKPRIARRFIKFLEQRARHAAAVYILGDLFDAWVGDDDFTPPNKAIRKALKALTEQGVAVFFQPGNRDFLVGQRFATDTGVTLLGDFEVVDLNGIRTLLTHGDLLCTDDLPYQAFRVRSRSPQWQRNVLSKPLWLRLCAARWYRLRSFLHKRGQALEIMDVNQEAVINALKGYGCQYLIHGHTHKPGRHQFEIEGRPVQRIVLSQWENDGGECLCWQNNAFTTEGL